MKKSITFNRKSLLAICLIVALLGVGLYILVNLNNNSSNSKELTVSEITKKFDCDRITADVRETDIFCGNPKFYNSPESVTVDDYSKFLNCDERLKIPPDVNSDIRQYYDDCKDTNRLKTKQQELIQRLRELKSKVLTS